VAGDRGPLQFLNVKHPCRRQEFKIAAEKSTRNCDTMSNDTNYTINIKGPSATVEALLDYLDGKLAFWEECKPKLSKLSGKKYDTAFKQLMKEAGVIKHAVGCLWMNLQTAVVIT
jgi:hypothetical protein